MAKNLKEKASYGTVYVDHLSPAKTEDWPRAINMTLSFEAALQLQLSLQHALLDINKLNRSTREGKRAAVDLCLWTGGVITVNRGKTRL